jgi:hypothetical protein
VTDHVARRGILSDSFLYFKTEIPMNVPTCLVKADRTYSRAMFIGFDMEQTPKDKQALIYEVER